MGVCVKQSADLPSTGSGKYTVISYVKQCRDQPECTLTQRQRLHCNNLSWIILDGVERGEDERV